MADCSWPVYLLPMRLPPAAVVSLIGANLACSHAPRTEAPAPSGPVIESLTPSQGPAGPAYPIEIIVTGTGFAPQGNIVTFGDISIPDLASGEGGTRIMFFAPKERPSNGEVPPFVLTPGQFGVTVTTVQGTSNTVNFALTRGP